MSIMTTKIFERKVEGRKNSGPELQSCGAGKTSRVVNSGGEASVQ